MHKTPFILGLLTLAVGVAHGASNGEEIGFIRGHALCVDGAGIPLSSDSESQVTYRGLDDPRVQAVCGLDGMQVQARAYSDWMQNLRTFENKCLAKKGETTFRDSHFSVPSDPSFCKRAQPVVGYNSFEQRTFNFRSDCPIIEAVCHFGENSELQAFDHSSPTVAWQP